MFARRGIDDGQRKFVVAGQREKGLPVLDIFAGNGIRDVAKNDGVVRLPKPAPAVAELDQHSHLASCRAALSSSRPSIFMRMIALRSRQMRGKDRLGRLR